MKVAVLMGGISKEREVSLRSGAAIGGALERSGHEVTLLDVRGQGFIGELGQLKPEAAFIALHGRFGEDGTVQGVLEWLKIPYTGSSVLSSALCFDKITTKKIVLSRGIATPDYSVYNGTINPEQFCASFSLGLPVIVKPNTEGSTIGISRVFEKHQLRQAVEEALCFDPVVLVEQYIQGREVTAAVFGGEAYPLVEVKPQGGFYDYESKYTKGKTDYLVPAPLDPALTARIQRMALESCQVLQCEGAVRADFMIDEKDQPWFLEVNTIPGMTETSLLPKAAQVMGIDFDELCDRILKSARLKQS